MKSYRQVLQSRVPAGQRNTRELVFFHRVHTLSALIQKLDAISPSEPPPIPIPIPPPSINVSHSGPITDKQFTVTGRNFLRNLLGTSTNGVAIRVVDANALIETRREHTSSNSNGEIHHVIAGDISGLVVNAAGIATIAFSATDGRPNSNLSGFLFSNTVRIDFP
jgi:hypothetical protein